MYSYVYIYIYQTSCRLVPFLPSCSEVLPEVSSQKLFLPTLPIQKTSLVLAFRMSFKTQHPQHPVFVLTKPSHPVKSCPRGGYTKEAPKKGSVVLAGPAGLTSSWQTAAPKQGKTAASPKSPKSTSFFSFSNGQFVNGVHGWGLPDTGVFLKTQLFEVVIRESVIRNSFRNKKTDGFLRTRGEKQNRRNCHPKQLSNKKNKTQNGDETTTSNNVTVCNGSNFG